MKKHFALILLLLLFISCKKDGKSRFIPYLKTETSLNGEATFTYNKENKLETITQADASQKQVTHTLAYGLNKELSSFLLSIISPNYNGINHIYEYNYTDEKISQVNRLDRPIGIGSYAYKYVFSYKNGKISTIDYQYSQTQISNRQNIPLERLEFGFDGKNLSSVGRYKYNSSKSSFIKIEEYLSIHCDDKANPYYIAFDGQPNFYVVNQTGYINGLNFINFNSISPNNFTSMDVKYYDNTSGAFIGNGRITQQNTYDEKGRLTAYVVTEQKDSPLVANAQKNYRLTYY